jgi:hypothetical protein
VDELIKNLPEIIKQSATSTLGILALMIIGLAILALFFFRTASERTRIIIFVVLFIGVAAFGAAVVWQTKAVSSAEASLPESFDAVYVGSVVAHVAAVADAVHTEMTLRLSVSGGVATGEYTNDLGDAGIFKGTVSGNSLDLKLISSMIPGDCTVQGRLSADRKKISAIYQCSDGEYAKLELTRKGA